MPRYLSNINLRKLSGKTCLLRVDLNIEPGEEKNAYRVDVVLPTIKLLLKNKIKVVILSHRGRPVLKSTQLLKGLKSDWDFNKINRRLSLKSFVPLLTRKLGISLCFIPYEHSWLLDPKKFISQRKERLFLFENLRFYRGEETNDWRLAKFLANWGDFYINDAFAVSHRNNASLTAITKYLPSYAGLLMEKEIRNLDKVMKNYKRPFTIILGGAKISDKIGVIKYFWNKADYFLIGGGPANTFFAAQGLPVGDSLINRSMLESPTSKILSSFNVRKSDFPKLILPVDVKIGDNKILDIGERTIEEYNKIIKKSKTIIWNGPMGMFEKKGFAKGTKKITQAICQLADKNKKAQIVIGGGETTAAFQAARGVIPRQVCVGPRLFISTGGGAMLEYLSGKKLPGITSLAGVRG
ncbi:phosphoglycerate kinase [Candidatus Jorgensenbacteria bacterium CG_4_10_14_0_8_um_filter_39_13]|uniref:Phosphoglycerate kinase n=2 Tax=Candidatus Joergenseniibacteriota TaxID=1752739 RepID=A0A2M7RJK3_9BACT|nr:MAG: phosphoglycerate kinase [Candidatus Jorgensenbacteria bacterium CG11_big_fil_rev_8_21_14_0_20_38_23]PIV12999.1 MAG: phosphoglycerate kinase [Candidatus Jorgensenbacteria bacterium CG03_land_8_20_14_0_80_38_39]PIW97897.1 MAG: phosphoglycerate kinase [Candidatus Jorgensenbacteria bacterium CG_4_8_14_3_um_filter_38_10]PIY96641.1 MAG: phosphoglycerate kinase [Candidatus Jorgensenbacteria bacterium CG_4_10_14_0_8_um_filter_39_13]PJA95202.1 MAG: phosphoglycerate kinase [Candidatus Jorgensenba